MDKHQDTFCKQCYEHMSKRKIHHLIPNEKMSCKITCQNHSCETFSHTLFAGKLIINVPLVFKHFDSCTRAGLFSFR